MFNQKAIECIINTTPDIGFINRTGINHRLCADIETSGPVRYQTILFKDLWDGMNIIIEKKDQ